MSVEDQLLLWFIKERVPADAVCHGDPPFQYRFYQSYFDLLVETKSEFWIVEAERNSNDTTIYKALGQLLFYQYLWKTYKDNADEKQLRLICLCPDECSEHAEKFLANHNVEFVKGNLQR